MSIRTYFENIADALRQKTGTQNTYTPEEMPDAIINIPSGGSIDLTNIKIIGLLCSKKRSAITTGYTQVGSLRLSDGSNYFNFTNISGRSASELGGYTTNSNEFAANVFNNSTANKGILNLYNNPSKFGWFIYIPTPVDCTTYNMWEWWTANDASDRDPVSFALYLSDGEHIVILDEQTDYDVTTSRNSLAYSGSIIGG